MNHVEATSEKNIKLENEAKRNDNDYSYVAAWEYDKNIKDSKLHKENLEFENVKLSSRSYK